MAAATTDGSAGAPASRRLPLSQVLRAFLWIGMVTFGGGRAAYFHEALVARRRWLGEGEFLEAVALSQMLPGPAIGNLAAYLGQRLGGWRGSVIAVTSVTIPGGCLILGLAWLYFGGMPAAVTGPVGRGVSAAAVGIALAAVIRLRGAARGLGGHAVAGLTFLLFGPLHWPIHVVLLVCVPPAFLLAWRGLR